MVAPVQRLTLATRMVLDHLLAIQGETYAYAIHKVTGLPSGSLSPILARLEAGGWVSSRAEDAAEAHAVGRPPRKFVRLTEEGAERARVLMEGPAVSEHTDLLG